MDLLDITHRDAVAISAILELGQHGSMLSQHATGGVREGSALLFRIGFGSLLKIFTQQVNCFGLLDAFDRRTLL